MTGKERAEKAVEYKHSGLNCCQAVVKAMADLVDADAETMSKMGSGFGAGMGCMEATCGSLIGATIISSLAKDGKGAVVTARELLMRFRELSGATLCKDLKGMATGKVLCECDDCVRNAIMALTEILDIEN